MTVRLGLEASFTHDQNGMTRADMVASLAAAKELGEIIIFRSTGPWAKRWLEKGYPSKNFHVKGKSSDWGPHAGLVPYDGTWSKVGYDPEKAAKGTKANIDGLDSGFAGKKVLVLTRQQIDEQATRPEGDPPRTAISSVASVPSSKDLLLFARRSGDSAHVAFRAFDRGGAKYEIHVYPETGQVATSATSILQAAARGLKAVPLEVMTSKEVGAGEAMTGDYDLFCVCPPWTSYGNSSTQVIAKPAIWLSGGPNKHGHTPKGQIFDAGTGLDRVMDPRLHTMGQARGDAGEKDRKLNTADFPDRLKQYEKRAAEPPKFGPQRPAPFAHRNNKYADDSAAVKADDGKRHEHEDMGNLTPRILRCINTLNARMGATGTKSALRRVHHNAESHRFRAFGALSEKDMTTAKDGDKYGDGFPLTIFQPPAAYSYVGPDQERTRACATLRTSYGEVFTLESLAEFRDYVTLLGKVGYFVPKNWIWNVPSNIDVMRGKLAEAFAAASFPRQPQAQ